ncbi:acetate/propionate family kinase [Tabrizicola oligotrophica]|uniref:Acetate kinase n=1 Tax=Tabrizicola oligotrophica TaxID=2710650 RepID=A0A6M0QW60_9RHOB|nr:acetate kinase [Tabrizicola oligotrophica]NEY91679.1 acetate kinase [Tabrizicola oligotrophica]
MLLVVNAGSSSLKLAVFDAGLRQVAEARSERIGAGGAADHQAALQAGLAEMGLSAADLRAAAHRVVHGGADLIAPCRVTPEVEAGIDACAALAPLHNPANLMGIRALAALAPDLAQYASFDTAFHATNPALATTYALPLAERERGLRRYGFHGLSYAAILRKLRAAQDDLPARLLVFHLGNGASACAILNGQSVATTMGYSPLDGLTMGSRGGSLDPAVVLDLARRHGVDGAAQILNRESGLKGLGGAIDMRALRGLATPEAQFAIAHFAYWAIRHAGSLIAAMGGLDAVVFTGGIGENDAGMRAAILSGLGWAGVAFDAEANRTHQLCLHKSGSHVAIWRVMADEERQIAIEAMQVIASEGT